MHIFILTINYNTANFTANCIKSVLNSTYKDFSIHLLDNASLKKDLTKLKSELQKLNSQFHQQKNVHFYVSEKNLGFAEGNNYLLQKIAYRTKNDDLILFLNSDTEIPTNLLETISQEFQNNSYDLAATKMISLQDKTTIDNLGLTVNKIGFGRNRTNKNTTLFGPSGGCAIYRVKCLENIKEKTGYYFDSEYFCYAEDTDLAWRALLLGHKPTHLENTLCYHAGGASSGKGFNKFVMYHTIRNWLYNLTKNMPSNLLIKRSPQILLFLIALFFRYLFTGKILTLLKAYKDFIKNFRKIKSKRKNIQQNCKITPEELQKYFTKEIF